MKKTVLTAFTALALLGTAATGIAFADSDHSGYQEHRGGSHGKGLMNEDERKEFTDAIREAETQEERQEIRNAMRKTMKERAKELGREFKKHGDKGHHDQGMRHGMGHGMMGKGMKTGDCPDKSQKSQES